MSTDELKERNNTEDSLISPALDPLDGTKYHQTASQMLCEILADLTPLINKVDMFAQCAAQDSYMEHNAGYPTRSLYDFGTLCCGTLRGILHMFRKIEHKVNFATCDLRFTDSYFLNAFGSAEDYPPTDYWQTLMPHG